MNIIKGKGVNEMSGFNSVKKFIINVQGIGALSSFLEGRIPNSIYFRKSKQLFFYKRIEIKYADRVIQIDDNRRMEDAYEIERSLSLIQSITILNHAGSLLTLTQLDIISLGGFKLSNSKEMAIEYYKSMLFDMLYDARLIPLCKSNKLNAEFRANSIIQELKNTINKLESDLNDCSDRGAMEISTLSKIMASANTISDMERNLEVTDVDVFELLDVGPSKHLSEIDISIIEENIQSDRMLYSLINNELPPIRHIANEYPYNIKTIDVNGYNISIEILDDIRIYRYNESLGGVNASAKDSS